MDIRATGHSYWLIVSCAPGLARVHLTETKPASPPEPPRFCMALRKYLMGAALTRFDLSVEDRIVTLGFTSHDGPAKLVCELFGRNGQLILLGKENRIIDTARRSSGERSLRAGDLYDPPAPAGRPDGRARDFGPGPAALAAGAFFETSVNNAGSMPWRRGLAGAVAPTQENARLPRQARQGA
ncbi:MAG: NFACT family protein [Deltaproteobacteria bacterium]|nr:NFACT family protein [Deltaproteobacteria bacterium]